MKWLDAEKIVNILNVYCPKRKMPVTTPAF